MATKKKLLQAAAGNAGGDAALNVEDVFSTYLYDGNGSTQTITNGIDLAGEGGLVWIKERDNAESHQLFDTERGNTKVLSTDSTSAEGTVTTRVTGFNSNGFSLGSNASVNQSSTGYASWTFRKVPKFFDVVTYTGDGTNNRKISHDLGSEVGCYIVKQINDGRSWNIYHRGLNNGNSPEDFILTFDTDAQTDVDYWNDTAPTSTEFTINNYAPINESGGTYVAYLFAHNDGDGEFGPDGNADIIKCGSYTGDGGAGTTEVDLGFEPQWILVKASSAADNWFVIDNMRGWATHNNTANDEYLLPNASNAESTGGFLDITSTGFKTTLYSNVNVSGRDYIYVAIRRPTAVPTSATEVFDFAPRTANAPGHKSGFVTDMFFRKNSTNASSDWFISDRLRQGKYSSPNTTAAELSASNFQFDYMNGVTTDTTATSTLYAWMWKRAPKYFDVVAYTGNGTAGRTVSHNLGVAPEMMWVKNRSRAGQNWNCYHKDIGNTKSLYFREFAEITSSVFWNNTSPTDTVFTVGTDNSVNYSGDSHIAYLFASLDGISKVGSVTHSGTTNVDCGFSSGARFVLLKRTDATGDWYIWDSTRGIVSGNDPYLLLNSTAAEVTNTDYIDPLSSGFTITSSFTAGTYIFYAIA